MRARRRFRAGRREGLFRGWHNDCAIAVTAIYLSQWHYCILPADCLRFFFYFPRKILIKLTVFMIIALPKYILYFWNRWKVRYIFVEKPGLFRDQTNHRPPKHHWVNTHRLGTLRFRVTNSNLAARAFESMYLTCVIIYPSPPLVFKN